VIETLIASQVYQFVSGILQENKKTAKQDLINDLSVNTKPNEEKKVKPLVDGHINYASSFTGLEIGCPSISTPL